jgi:hypothetical protein
MRCLSLMSVLLSGAIISPVLGQSHNLLETSRDAERRRQAEQHYYEQEQQRRGNMLNTEKPRGLGEAPSSSPSSQPRTPVDSYDPNLPRECPPNHYMC